MIRFVFTPLRKITSECLLIDCPPPLPRDYSSQESFFFWAQKHGGNSGCRGGGRNGQLPSLCGRLEERVHIARHLRKGNRYGSMAPPSVTAASHIHGDKRRAAAGPARRRQRPLFAIVLQVRGFCSAGSPCSLSPARVVGHCSSQTHTFTPLQTATF